MKVVDTLNLWRVRNIASIDVVLKCPEYNLEQAMGLTPFLNLNFQNWSLGVEEGGNNVRMVGQADVLFHKLRLWYQRFWPYPSAWPASLNAAGDWVV